MLFGYDSGVISGILEMEPFNRKYGSYWDNIPSNLITASNPAMPGFALSTANRSLVVSILSVGTFFGALLAAPAADILGRRWGIQAAVVVFNVGVIMQCVAGGIPLFVVGRVFAGM